MIRKSVIAFALLLVIAACSNANAAVTSEVTPAWTPSPAPTATETTPVIASVAPDAALTPEAAIIQPETVNCLRPEDIATWCANLEPVDSHGLWEMAINAMLDGPANAEYWAEVVGKENPTHEEKFNWLKANDYYLPAQSPDGTDFLWLAATGNGSKYAEFKVNSVMQAAGGVSMKDISFVVVTPEKWPELKAWYRDRLNENKGSFPISDSPSAYNPGELYGWLAVRNEKTGLVEMVFIGGSGTTGGKECPSGTKDRYIGCDGVDTAKVLTAMFDTLMRATREFDPEDLDLNDPDALNPNMRIDQNKSSAYPTDPVDVEDDDVLFRELQ